VDAFVIDGGARLNGRVSVNGSKNASLPLMCAALLTTEPVVLEGVPRLADIANLRKLLHELGCSSEESGNPEAPNARLAFRTTDESDSHARYEIVRTMRASISVLGPLLARRGTATVAMPGGCAIGDRPVDIHLRGLRALGADIRLDGGNITARAPASGRLRGARIFLGGPAGPTVLGTANVMSAAALAEGTTVIESAACEPEVADLADLINTMGGSVRGAGTPRVVIEGVRELRGATHRVIPDRIEAGTYLIAAGITNGHITIENCPIDDLLALNEHLREIGVHVRASDDSLQHRQRTTVEVSADRNLRPTQVTTQPHPGFPTDLQAQLMALLCLAEGNSVITERIYPQRFLHVAELTRMGAQLIRQGSTVVATGVRELVGAPVMASDLRASASLVLAGLAAKGRTTVHRVYHLDRGYHRMEEALRRLGARIERVDEKSLPGAGAD